MDSVDGILRETADALSERPRRRTLRYLELVRDGNPIYAWPFAERHVWRAPRMPQVARALERATRAQ